MSTVKIDAKLYFKNSSLIQSNLCSEVVFVLIDGWQVSVGAVEVTESSTGTSSAAAAAATGEVDFESLVLMRLRQAEERKRLAQQMAVEDD